MDSSTLRKFANDPLDFIGDLTVPSAAGPCRFAAVMADFQRVDFQAIAPSLLALTRGEKPPIGRFWIERTKGASKDSDLACCLLWLLAFSPRPLRVQIGAYDSRQADEVRLIVKAILRLDGPLNHLLREVIEVQRSLIVNTRTESTAEILTTDSKGTHGSRPDVVLIDELSHVDSQEFAETLADNLDKMPNGLMLIATNAGYVQTWQHAWRNIAVSSDRWHFSPYKQPAPWINPADLEESRLRNSAARYARLWAGEWVRDGGDALDIEDIEACVTLEPPPHVDHPSWGSYFGNCRFVAGLDLATKRHHSALVVLGVDDTRRIRLAHVQSWRPIAGKVDLTAVREGVLAAHRSFRFAACYYDPFQAALMAQDLGRQNVPMREFQFVGRNLNTMASKLIETFRAREINLYPDERLIGDLTRLTIVERQFGFKLEAAYDAEHGHADTAFALAIALPAATGFLSSAGLSWGGVIKSSDLRTSARSMWGWDSTVRW